MTSIEKLNAQSTNEGTKLTANLLNALAASAFVGGIVAPVIAGKQVDFLWTLLVALVGVLLHLVGRLLLFDLKPEDRNGPDLHLGIATSDASRSAWSRSLARR